MATRARTLTSARSNLMWLTTGVHTQAIISEAGTAGTASHFSPRLVNYWLCLVSPVITGADGICTSVLLYCIQQPALV